MSDQRNLPEITFVVRVTPGRSGLDPNAPDWEVLELEDGVVRDDSNIYNNLTQAEAQTIARMWSKKKGEAESKAEEDLKDIYQHEGEDNN